MNASSTKSGLSSQGNSRAAIKERMAAQARQRLDCERIAETEAMRDLAFLGDEAWKGYSAEQRRTIETALVRFARIGAARAWSFLTKNP